MKIGVLSDTHDNLPGIARAVRFFNIHKVNFVLHAGDLVAPFTVPVPEAFACQWRGVFGNNEEKKTVYGGSRVAIVDLKTRSAHIHFLES